MVKKHWLPSCKVTHEEGLGRRGGRLPASKSRTPFTVGGVLGNHHTGDRGLSAGKTALQETMPCWEHTLSRDHGKLGKLQE